MTVRKKNPRIVRCTRWSRLVLPVPTHPCKWSPKARPSGLSSYIPVVIEPHGRVSCCCFCFGWLFLSRLRLPPSPNTKHRERRDSDSVAKEKEKTKKRSKWITKRGEAKPLMNKSGGNKPVAYRFLGERIALNIQGPHEPPPPVSVPAWEHRTLRPEFDSMPPEAGLPRGLREHHLVRNWPMRRIAWLRLFPGWTHQDSLFLR